jgi:signal transduction histidine kinase/ActR/RegA family two-component response regulator
MSPRKESTSLTIAIIVTVLTLVVFLFLFLFLGINHRKDVYEDAKKLAIEISRKAAFETQVYLSSAVMTARSFEQKSQLLRKLGGDRDEIDKMLKEAIVRNPNFMGAWTMWEPNAFDSKDRFYTNNQMYDTNGTMSICYFKLGDSLLYERNEPSDFFEDFYAIPKANKKELIIDPFYYQYHGHPYIFYQTSAVVPVMDDTLFLGVFGVDIELDTLMAKLNKVKLYETGYLALISNNGIIVSHRDTSFIDKNINLFIQDSDSDTYKAIKQGRELALETKSEFTGFDVFRFFYPIKVGRGDNPWSMMVEIPIEEATVRSKQLFYIAIGTLLIGLSLLLYLIINISDRRRYEKEILAAKAKAEESNRLKTAFLNNISHEIRTPLNGILGFSELLIDSDLDAEQAKVYKDIIHNSSNQLLSIISNVIELSKIQSSQIEKIIKEFEIEKTILKVVETYNPALKEKNLKLVLNFPETDQPLLISTDESKLKQVLSYLINNAIKFTNSGSVEIGFYDQGNSFLFYVMDTGIGIKQENFNNIFKYFNQEDSSMNRNFGGLGVGLSISKSYIDLLGGSIRFESEVNKGTTFYFTLPNLQLKQTDIKNLHDGLSEKSKFTILIAEDEKHNYILLKEILSNSGIKTIWAANGEEAIEICKKNPDIKLVFMDIKMPVLNGFEATKVIKAENRKIPVVAVTGNYTAQEVSNKIIFDSIITKPVKREDIVNALKMAAQRNQEKH